MTQQHPLIEKWLDLKADRGHCLCIGLDPDVSKLPRGYVNSVDGINHFLKDIVDITVSQCISYKPNISFFEAYGIEGLKCLESIIAHIDQRVPVILDAKRGDIGNTSAMQARYLFDYFNADASTLHPYMGEDSVAPFLNYKERYHFVLALTSNSGAADFEQLMVSDQRPLYQHVLEKCVQWHHAFGNVGVVVGATQESMVDVRACDDELVFLIPGVGAQGGTYATAYDRGKNKQNLALINVSRSVLYASEEKSKMDNQVKEAISMLVQGGSHV